MFIVIFNFPHTFNLRAVFEISLCPRPWKTTLRKYVFKRSFCAIKSRVEVICLSLNYSWEEGKCFGDKRFRKFSS